MFVLCTSAFRELSVAASFQATSSFVAQKMPRPERPTRIILRALSSKRITLSRSAAHFLRLQFDEQDTAVLASAIRGGIAIVHEVAIEVVSSSLEIGLLLSGTHQVGKIVRSLGVTSCGCPLRSSEL
jgi:hypothetical protein